MKLGGGFAPTVLRSVDAGGYLRDGAGVHNMNDTTKTPCYSFTPTSDSKSREKAFGGDRALPRTALQLAQHRGAYWRGERLLRLGTVAPRKAESGPLCNRSASQTSLMPMASVNCAKSMLTT
jgi:hypothetical protein